MTMRKTIFSLALVVLATGGCDIVVDPSAWGPREISVGPTPTPIVQTGNELAIGSVDLDFETWAYGTGTITWIDPTLEVVTGSTEVGMNPQAMSGLDDGNLAVVCTGDYGFTPGVVYVLDGPTHIQLGTIDIGGAPSACAAGDGSILYLGSSVEGGVAMVDCRTMTVERAWDPHAGFSAAGIAALPSGSVVAVDFAQDLLIQVDEYGDILQAITVGDGPVRVAVDPNDENRVYVLHSLGETMGVANLATGTFAEFSTETGIAPNHILWSAEGLWVVSSVSNLLDLRDPITGAVLSSHNVGTNHNPMEVVVTGDKAFVTSFLTNTVTVIDI